MTLSNIYATLPQFSAPPTPHNNEPHNNKRATAETPTRDAHASRYRLKIERRRTVRHKKANGKRNEEICFEEAINVAEDKETATAKAENKVTPPTKQKVDLLQRGKSVG